MVLTQTGLGVLFPLGLSTKNIAGKYFGLKHIANCVECSDGSVL